MAGLTTNANLCQHDALCTDSSYAKCPHCSLNLCLEHLNEHQQIVRLQFNELIDRVNEQKAALNNHSAIYKIRDKVLADLDEWKAKKIETIVTIYNQKRTQVANACEECIVENANIQTTIFPEINTASNMIEKKKNVHPHDIQQIEQKLKKLNISMETYQNSIKAELKSIVQDMKLPDVIELEEQLHAAQAMINKMTQEYQQAFHQMDIIIHQINNERFTQQRDNELQQRIYNLHQILRIFRN